jgi:NAD(P)-dependent dehydrogenase (short-subunit alcohol dehydrogenase family)
MPAALVTRFSLLWRRRQDVADMADKTHTILIAGGSGLVGHAAIKFAIAAGHFVIALVRRDPAISICAPKAKRKRPFAPAAICASTPRVRVFFWVSGLKLAPVSASASLQRRWLRRY